MMSVAGQHSTVRGGAWQELLLRTEHTAGQHYWAHYCWAQYCWTHCLTTVLLSTLGPKPWPLCNINITHNFTLCSLTLILLDMNTSGYVAQWLHWHTLWTPPILYTGTCIDTTLALLHCGGSIAGIIAAATTSLCKQANTTIFKEAPTFIGSAHNRGISAWWFAFYNNDDAQSTSIDRQWATTIGPNQSPTSTLHVSQLAKCLQWRSTSRNLSALWAHKHCVS